MVYIECIVLAIAIIGIFAFGYDPLTVSGISAGIIAFSFGGLLISIFILGLISLINYLRGYSSRTWVTIITFVILLLIGTFLPPILQSIGIDTAGSTVINFGETVRGLFGA